MNFCINPLNVELNPICHLLALLGAHLILHISGVRVNYLNGAHNGELVTLLLQDLFQKKFQMY